MAPRRRSRSTSDQHKLAVEQFTFSARTYKKQRDRETEYLKFQVPEFQWEQRIRDYRSSQFGNTGVPMPPDPTLSISLLDEPISLVENQERGAHLGVHIHPLTEDATSDTAQVLEDLYRHIEVDPEAQASVARSWAFARALRAGTGWRYVAKVFDPYGGHPFDQKLLIKRVLYQDGIYPDPTAEEADWSDGLFLHDVIDLPWETYKRRYPKSEFAKFSDADFKQLGPIEAAWVPHAESRDYRAIRISNYWRVELQTRRYVLLDDGTVADERRVPEGRHPATDDDVAAMGYGGVRTAEIEERVVYRSVINGMEDLEDEVEWDGHFIPYIPSIGIELSPFDGERRWIGMVANAMDAQRLVNYAASQAVKLAALEPQAPWQGEEGVFEGHEEEYRQNNTRKFPFVQYKPTNSAGMRSAPPSRVQVDTSRLGPSMELLAMGKDFVQRATFTFGPGNGEQTPAHRSGTAIQALQGQTTLGTSHYLDNEANLSMPLEAKIVLDLIPAVYSRPGRVVHVITGEGATRAVMLNRPHVLDKRGRPVAVLPNAMPGQPVPADTKHYDLSLGRYGVAITIGKQSDARLQEGSDALSRLMEAEPTLLPVIGPQWARFQDFPGAKAVQAALVKWQAHVAPWMLDNPTPDQQLQQLQQQVQQLTQVTQQQAQVIATKQIEQRGKLSIVQEQEAHDDFRASLDREKAIAVAEINAQAKQALQDMALFYEERARIGAQIHEAAMGGREAAHNIAVAREGQRHEVGMAMLDHGSAIDQANQLHDQAVVQAEQAHDHALAQTQQQASLTPPAAPGATPGGTPTE